MKKQKKISPPVVGVVFGALVALVALVPASLALAAATTGFEGCIYGVCTGGGGNDCGDTFMPEAACSTSNSSNPANVIANFEGATVEVAAIKAGQFPSKSKGYLTLPNEFLLLIQDEIAAGVITAASIGPSGVTFTPLASTGLTGMKLHTVFSQAPTVDGTTYSYDMKLWICDTTHTPNCAATDYYPKAYIAWTVSADGFTNNGVMALLWGQYNGSSAPVTAEGGMNVQWDVGAASTNRYVHATMYDTTGGNPPSAMRFEGTKNGSVLNLGENWIQWTSGFDSNYAATGTVNGKHRDAVTFDTSALTGAYSGEAYDCEAPQGSPSGVCTTNSSPATADVSATSDVATSWQCFTAAVSGGDYAYTPVTSGQTCTLTASYPSMSITSLEAISSPSLVGVVGGSLLNGMTSNPPNI